MLVIAKINPIIFLVENFSLNKTKPPTADKPTIPKLLIGNKVEGAKPAYFKDSIKQ